MKTILTSLILVLALAGTATAADITGRASVIDGDTIEIGGTRIRFDGVDAPETRQVCHDAKGRDYRCGRVAAEALDDFLARSRPTTCKQTGKHYKRVVAVCRRADGADINSWLVRNGHAVDWPRYSKGRYAADQNRAKAARIGIWSGRFEMPCSVRRATCK